MSRLDTFIERMQAQRICLGLARQLIASLPGPVLELGLGNGRTFDHLRELFPEREIFVFERQPAAHPACMPDAAHLFVGDLKDTLLGALERLPGRAALVHSDIGTADAERNARLARWLAAALPPLMAPDALIASDQRLDDPALKPMPMPAGVPDGRYFLYRHAAGGEP
jgi:hypothetical protein